MCAPHRSAGSGSPMPSKKSTSPVSREYSAPTIIRPSFWIRFSMISDPCRRCFDGGPDVGAHGLVKQLRPRSCLSRSRADPRPTAAPDRRWSAGSATGFPWDAAAARASHRWRRSSNARGPPRAACRTARRRTRRCRSAMGPRCCRRRGSRTGPRAPDRRRSPRARANRNSREWPRIGAWPAASSRRRRARRAASRGCARPATKRRLPSRRQSERVPRRDHRFPALSVGAAWRKP